MTVYEGTFTQLPKKARFALVASRFNHFIVERLVDGAIDALRRHGVPEEQIDVVHVPGAWELPWAVARLCKAQKHSAVIALGAVIRGATPHFDYVAGEAAKGVAQAMMKYETPVVFGVLTTDTIEQAIERAGTKAGNKGFDAGMAAIELVALDKALTDASL